jgi:hypothetical protein
VTLELEQVVRTRLARGVRQVLVHWKDQSVASMTWEDLDTFRDKYPDFHLEDELDIEGGGRDVMWGRSYNRRRQDQQHPPDQQHLPDRQHLPDQQHLSDRQHLPDRQHLMGRTYSRRRRARDVRRAVERAEHACEKDSTTRG